MIENKELIVSVMKALVTALCISFAATPFVRRLAFTLGAVDVPRDNRRMHNHPIPRLGGLAIFLGFVISVLVFCDIDLQLQGILIGAVMIVILGVIDDIMSLPARLKLVVQIAAALCAVLHGVAIEAINNPNIFSENPYWILGFWSYPISIIWIVAITNSVNLIDGLDGLADGVSTIAALTMLILAVLLGEWEISVICGALVGACVGFIPYNLNPAKIFMGDTGSTFLGFVMAVASIEGLFKLYNIISFAVPFLMLGLPIFDTCSAILRRVSHGQSPMAPDRSHVHHKLIDMGFSQKQAVAVLYVISAILGLSAVVLTTSGEVRAMMVLMALCAAGAVSVRLVLHGHGAPPPQPPRSRGGNDPFFGEEDQSDK